MQYLEAFGIVLCGWVVIHAFICLYMGPTAYFKAVKNRWQ